MSKLVMKLLRKGESPQDQKVRKRLGTLGSGVGVGVNALLAAGKLLIGSLTGSVAVTADAPTIKEICSALAWNIW